MIRHNRRINLNYILVFFVMYFSFQSMGSRIYKVSNIIPIIYFISIIIYFIHCQFKKIKFNKSIKFNAESIIVYNVLLINIVITMLINQDFTQGYYVLVMSLTSGLLFSTLINKEDFYDIYVNIIVFISVFSLICTYAVIPILGFIKQWFPIFINEHGVEYINLLFATPIINEGFYRNVGIYSEPGMFQVFITFALISELFLINRKINVKKVVILLISMISTFSPAAYTQVAIILFGYCIKRKDVKTKINSKKLVKAILFLSIIILLLINVFPETRIFFIDSIDKLFKEGSSLEGRSAAIIANILAGLKNPFSGLGITGGFEYVHNVFLTNITDSNTSTTTAIFLVFGIIAIISITYLQIKLIFSSKSGFICNFIVFLAFLMSINSQLLIYDQMFYIICFSGFMKSSDKYNKDVNTKEIESHIL